jgi:hypothetical protein
LGLWTTSTTMNLLKPGQTTCEDLPHDFKAFNIFYIQGVFTFCNFLMLI